IFPPLVVDEESFVDGGVADNIPVFPTLMEGPVDELVAICLRPTPEDTIKKAWQESERSQRLKKTDPDVPEYSQELSRRSDPPTRLPYLEPGAWPKKLLLIAPKNSFGNFLTATLNFSQRKARKLLELGW